MYLDILIVGCEPIFKKWEIKLNLYMEERYCPNHAKTYVLEMNVQYLEDKFEIDNNDPIENIPKWQINIDSEDIHGLKDIDIEKCLLSLIEKQQISNIYGEQNYH